MRRCLTRSLAPVLLLGPALLAGCGGGGGGGSGGTPAPGSDVTPAAFTFVDQADVAPNATITSAPVTIGGIDAPAPVSVTGGTYSVGCTATYVASAGTIDNGQTLCVRHTSASAPGVATQTTVTVGGVADTFTSTTAGAGPVVGLLPFVTGAGDVRLLDPSIATGSGNPATVDTGLAPPQAGAVCIDCFEHAETFHAATIAGTSVTNLHAARLAYARRGNGNDAGAAVFRVNLAKNASHAPVRISSRTDACRIVRTETTELTNVDHTAVVLERAGADGSCGASADNVVTVIRLDSPVSDAGLDLPLALETGNPLHARTNATGAVIGYVSFEIVGPQSWALVRRDANLANPVTLLPLGQITGANLERADLTRLFVTATPVADGLKLYRVETNGALSPVLHSFAGFNAGNPIQDGWRDATRLFFSDENRLLAIPVDATSEDAVVLTTLDHPDTEQTLRIGHRMLDLGTTPGRVVFEAQDDSITTEGGVFSVATNATDDAATVLAHNADSLGGFAVLAHATGGRAYINVAHHGGEPTHSDALKVGTDGTNPATTPAAYWAGSTRATAFDVTTMFVAPVQHLFLATRAVAGDGSGTDTLRAVDPASGGTGHTLGTVDHASVFLAINVDALGRHALARVERDRFGELDYDVFHLDAASAGSFAPLAETEGATDLPLDSLQRLTGNLCLLCL